jgi:hypothetical protein
MEVYFYDAESHDSPNGLQIFVRISDNIIKLCSAYLELKHAKGWAGIHSLSTFVHLMCILQRTLKNR